MKNLKETMERRLTARETLVAIALIAAVAGLVLLGCQTVEGWIVAARVRAATPRACDAIRAQRAELVQALEAYRTRFGIYPPDHVVGRQPLVVDPITNTLLYELAGVIHDKTNKTYYMPGVEPAAEDYVRRFFGVQGFRNGADSPEGVVRFLKTEPLPAFQLHDDPDVFVVGTQGAYEELPPNVAMEFFFGPWRYVSSSPTNNVGGFDLWMDLDAGGRHVVIGNWKAVE